MEASASGSLTTYDGGAKGDVQRRKGGGGHQRKAAVAAAEAAGKFETSFATFGYPQSASGSGSSYPSSFGKGAAGGAYPSSFGKGAPGGSTTGGMGASGGRWPRDGHSGSCGRGKGSGQFWQQQQWTNQTAHWASSAGAGPGSSYGVRPVAPVVVPPPAQTSSNPSGLRDLLAQVAPQARIQENSSQLTSKASANILSRVLAQASSSDSAQPASGEHRSQQQMDNWFADYNYYNNDYFMEQSGSYGQGGQCEANGRGANDCDDDEDKFMENWQGLFSKGSQLVDGSAVDPFADLADLKRRNQVKWKKNSERKGHRQRYQERKNTREQEALALSINEYAPRDDQGDDHAEDGDHHHDNDDGAAASSTVADAEVSVVCDTTKPSDSEAISTNAEDVSVVSDAPGPESSVFSDAPAAVLQ